ncbi:pyridoxal phosphate-dependent decarboxylase family protein [Thioalkalivibrio sp. HK1]|uniref:pyridoxal phosphate-dependent decarboxylase family protein n=1 Tax=Thioalkalivibrio sp. HK1 TaxID=1469245 RepID=UPI0004B48B5A|nr:pyridoxal-dependent decarboxylase [Thioalkalivibrio sp. HK1]
MPTTDDIGQGRAESMRDLLEEAAQRALSYLGHLPQRPVAAACDAPELMRMLGEGDLPFEGRAPAEVLALLDEVGRQGTVASAGPRYFGFVTGGSLPIALAANWLAGAWDQNAFSEMSSPMGAAVERVALSRVLGVLDLPRISQGAFVTGATMANFTALAAARRRVLLAHDHDVDKDGLTNAPPITVAVGESAHATVLKAIGLLGLGRASVVKVAADAQGRMCPDALSRLKGPAIVCAQAGNVNTGAIDPIRRICAQVPAEDVWVHVDGAFGLWVRALRSVDALDIEPSRKAEASRIAEQGVGLEDADSWATDAHKWLNVPYDCGIALVRDAEALRGAMSMQADYLPQATRCEPFEHTPEASRRMRALEVLAVLDTLGARGLCALIERNCHQARRFAESLSAAGFEVLNEVALNQVLVSFGDDATTLKVIRALQEEGTCWCGGTRWQNRDAMRISLSSWATTDDDVDRSLEAMLRVARDIVG